MQEKIDEARGKFADLEEELRELQSERNDLLQEIHGEAKEASEDGMEDDDEDAEEEAAAKRRRDEAENEFQEVKSRRILRAQAKKRADRSAPYARAGDDGI